MSQSVRVGIIGCGWPGAAHARGYREAGGFKIAAVADLISQRRKQLMAEHAAAKEYTEAMELVADGEIDAVSVCLPTSLHAPVALAALRRGKHVICEKPPALNSKQAKQIERAAAKAGKIVMYSLQRRFGGAEQAARQAIAKGYAGEVFHARAQWLRTRGMPIGTGWYPRKAESGGGSMIDIGVHMLDLGWHLLGSPKPLAVFATTYEKFKDTAPKNVTIDVEDSAFAMVRFEGGKSLEVAASWTFNQPPQQQGTLCRVYGDKAAIDVYTPSGATLYRNFDEKGQAQAVALKPPKFVGHGPLMRHFRECILGKATPQIGPREGVTLMQMVDAIYRSAASGKSAEIKS